jgi:hypothetical protein
MGSPAGTFDELQAEIGQRYPALSRQLQRIARFALERPQDVASTPWPPPRQGRSPALGDGALRPGARLRRLYRHAAHLPRPAGGAQRSYRERIASLRRDAPARVAPEGGAARLRRRLDRQPLAPRGARAPETLRRAVRCSRRARRIHVLAQRRAFPVACYLAYALAQLELPVTLLDGVGGMVREQARAHPAGRRAGRGELPQLFARGDRARRRRIRRGVPSW